ncbi:MAG TPA: putative methyltransferase [Dehalococcoidia bacterium]|jgi:predicted methyltransferase|nr:putative methyltransferase [Dehalococcoidia bacterium]
MDKSEAEDILIQVSVDSRLQEGYQGVRLIMREIFRGGIVPIHDISRATGIPVPALSATRRELEKRKLLSRKGGAILTDTGIKLLHSIGILDTKIPDFNCQYKVSDTVTKLVSQFDKLTKQRPSPDYSLDQSHATSLTCFKRVMYFHQNDSLEGRDIAILGDDDLTSLAMILFTTQFGLKINSLTVFDIDERILNFIESMSFKLNFEIRLNKIDFIEEISPCYKNSQDVFITDPPYTVEGLTRFISIGAEMLKERTNGLGFVSYSNLIPVENARLFINIASMGLSPQELIPAFNEYVGAQKHAGISKMGKFFSSGYLKTLDPTPRNLIYTNSKETSI